MGTNYNSTFMARNSAFSPYRLIRREAGFQNPIGAENAIAKSLYCGMKPIASWDSEQANDVPTGGVFNLEFSPEGSLLVAACEKRSIQIFDPLTHQRIHSVNGAHSDCVNCVKFLDGRMFATCSDDATIALWDIRNLKKKICSLLGHSNWVKNIEFSVKDKLLVTSGLDGSIYTWDINSYTEYNVVHHRVFHASGLMRCRLSPDAGQMVMCTTGGLLVIIHNLNLSTLARDLHGFKPNLYRLMQMSQQLIPIAAIYDHLFDCDRQENRVEFVSDFPEGNDAKVVSALQIHPQGWSALSRNISHDDRSEAMVVHPRHPAWRLGARERNPRPLPAPRRTTTRRGLRLARLLPFRSMRAQARSQRHNSRGESSSSREEANSSRDGDNEDSETDDGSDPVPPQPPSQPEPQSTVQPVSAATSRLGPGLPSILNDVWEASITIKQHRMVQDMYIRGQVGRNFNMQRIMGINTGITPPASVTAAASSSSSASASASSSSRPRASSRPPPLLPDNTDNNSPSTSGQTPQPRNGPLTCDEEAATRHFIRQNRERLLYYIEETNEGRGFIKELCYSADGRLVCSPFGHGMRLLALNENCSELSHCIQDAKGPAPMVDVGQSLGIHRDLVVSSKFSPRHHLLVTGCLEGKIVWYEPYSGEGLY